ncbi:MAG TPA: amidohydrolase family protein [Steroidobacteraceae bacterium]|jgi:predicted amidohydrolase YtcJ|nr:amidohydrolase family protein [Steroidobacteraceae bacterium]
MLRHAAIILSATLLTAELAAANTPADLVVTEARIYTAGTDHGYADALAVRGGKLVYVGSASGAAEWIGPATKVENLHGKLVLPGLIDSHIHPSGIVDLDVCDLDSKAKSLAEITVFVRGCIERYKIPAGEWVNVRQWNFSDNNRPDGTHPTLRAALDLASTQHPIQLLGNDGHHGAFNSMALARAKNAKGERIGFSRATLAKEFAGVAKLLGVDANGEPNGTANEEARTLMEATFILFVDLPEVMKAPERITQRLNSVGITGMLDAAVAPELLPMYDALEKSGKLTVRTTLAQWYDPERYRDAAGTIDYDKMVGAASAVRAKYADDPLIRADVVKLFADGVLEGNPNAVPPTLPEVASLHAYLQPIFSKDKSGRISVTGYVDTGSKPCQDVRANAAKYGTPAAIAAFIKANGHHPGQCAVSIGQLQHERAVILEFVRRFHLAGFSLHIHAINDAAVRAAVDAIEAARAADGVASQHDALAHVQVVNPEDVTRIGRDHLYLACTFSWANFDPEYDMTVVPFIDKVNGNSYSALHPANGYYESAVYPFKALKDAGGILVGGSDAPVNTRDPQPFVNIAVALTRQIPGQPPITPVQRLGVRDAVDAYTINGARYLNRDVETGSIEVGKSADFIVLDRDILKLAEAGQAADIARTQVLETWFKGVAVYRRRAP